MNKIIKASGNEVEPYWPGLFAKALEGQDIGALLTNVGSAGPAGGAGAAAGGDAGEAKKEEEKPSKSLVSISSFHSVSRNTTIYAFSFANRGRGRRG